MTAPNEGPTSNGSADAARERMHQLAAGLTEQFGEMVREIGARLTGGRGSSADVRLFGEMVGKYVETFVRLTGRAPRLEEEPEAKPETEAAPAAEPAAAAARPTPESSLDEIPVVAAAPPPRAPIASRMPPPPMRFTRSDPPTAELDEEDSRDRDMVLRSPAQIADDLAAVERELEQLPVVGEESADFDSRLMLLKSLACRQRGLFDELQMGRSDDTRARELYGALKQVIERTVPRTSEPPIFQYVIPLDTRVSPREPADWYEAALRFREMADCLPAVSWLFSTVGFLSDGEKKEILEPAAARQQRLYRVLHHCFRCNSGDSLTDPQQGSLFGRLREYARTNSIYLLGLNGQTDEYELERLSSGLDAAWERQRLRVKRRQEQEEAVAKVLATVSSPRFGSRDEHALMLQTMVRRALETGALPNRPDLRDGLLEHARLLEGDEKMLPLIRAIDAELKRRDARRAAADVESKETGLDPQRAAELEKLLPLIRGTKAVIIGGICREENRKAIHETLQFSDVVWPDTTGRESVYDFESLVADQHTKVVFLLIRFMRTGYGRVAELCRTYGKTLVRIPAGYGTNQVIHQLAEQMGGPAQSAEHPMGVQTS